ncbi:hypothetical protein SUGI_0140760 [Cryptomeria japonica]|nr:hypothetical protein SUGI_0140760 [Cryptomeria japonica]
MENRQQAKIWRSGVKVHEINSESLREMWEHDLTDLQRGVLVEAGILPFLYAVTYRCDTALCAAVIDFMADGQLTVGDRRMDITEDQIREATGLPTSGKIVSPTRNYHRGDILMRLTRSGTAVCSSGVLVEKIVNPNVRFACKFLACKLLGVKTPGCIPFKYVETAIEVSQGVCFNWCKFVKERMFEQIESIQKRCTISFDYPTILQYLAFKAFDQSWIPRTVITPGDPSINIYKVLGRDGEGSREDKRVANNGISHIVHNIMMDHGHRVLGGDGREEQGVDRVNADLFRLSREKSMWEAEKMHLESEKEQLQMENSRLEAALQQEIQKSASTLDEKKELQMRINRLETALGQHQAKLKRISEFMKMEVAANI